MKHFLCSTLWILYAWEFENEGKSAVSFCHQVAAWVPNMFCNFYFVKRHKSAKTRQPLKLEKKLAQIWNPMNFRNFGCVIE
jgi:hypothetical protein